MVLDVCCCEEKEMVLFRQTLNQPPEIAPPREILMLFSPWCYGHYPSYLRYLIECQKSSVEQSSSSTIILVSPEFFQVHRDIVAIAEEDCPNLCFLSLTPAEEAKLYAAKSGWKLAFIQYELVAKYAKQLNPTHVLMMYFDSCQLPFVFGRNLPCSFSGIYFRPTLHYPKITRYAFSFKEQLQAIREQLFLFRLLRHPQLKTLFCLDPFAVEAMNQRQHNQFVYLPDPVETSCALTDSEDWRTRLGIEPNRQVFLSFGRLGDDRKGVAQLMDAVTLLPPELCQRLCLLFVGESHTDSIQRLEERFTQVQRSHPVQIVRQYGHVPDSDVNAYFQISDAVLAPYQKHVGMSGILLQAAAAQKPVLSSDYGLMGAMVNRYRLGLAVDTTNAQAIAAGLVQLLQSSANVGDRQRMKAFAEENSAEQFASVIFQHL